MSQKTDPLFFIKPEYLLNLGYKLISEKDNCYKYESFGGKALKSVITGYSQPLWNGQRIISFNSNDFDKMGCIYCGVKCDAGTRTVFSGVITSEQDFLDMIRLID